VHHPALASSTAAQVDPLLQRLRENDGSWKPLDGKIFALISASEDAPLAALFRRAATGLGARVAWMRPSLGPESGLEVVHATGRVLGKLYDAIECQGLEPDIAAAIAAVAGVPVFASLAAAASEPAAAEDERRLLLQSRLLRALA